MKKVFLAFGGRKDETLKKVTRVTDNLEVWNLTLFEKNELLSKFRAEVFIYEHLAVRSDEDLFKLNWNDEHPPTWGMLIGETLLNSLELPELRGMMNLFSDTFLAPIFAVNDLGGESIINWEKQWYDIGQYWGQGCAQQFLDGKFVDFCTKLTGQEKYFVYNAFYFEKWLSEPSDARKQNHFRIFLSCTLFQTLKHYQNSKEMILYLKESSEIVTAMEALLINSSGQNHIKLSERMDLLLSTKYLDIKNDILALYEKRSEFVHGNYFKALSKSDYDEAHGVRLPLPEFEFLLQATHFLRDLIIVYLYLNKKVQGGAFGGIESVYQLIKTPQKHTDLVDSAKEILSTLNR